MAQKPVSLYIPKAVRILQPTAVQSYQTYIQFALKELEPRVEQIAVNATPIGAFGLLQDSVKVETLPGTMTIEWTSPYVSPVDKGSKPHWAPIDPLKLWVFGKLGETVDVAYRLQRKIAKRGTKAAHYSQKARSKIYQYAVPAFRQRMKILAQLLSGNFGP